MLIQNAFRVSHVSVLLKDDDDLVLRAHHGDLTPRIPEGGRLTASAGLWGRALETGKTLIENDVKKSSDCINFYVETNARMCIPLVSFGQTLGVLVLDSAQTGAFNPNDIQSLESVADICATAIQNAHYVDRVKQLAYLDRKSTRLNSSHGYISYAVFCLKKKKKKKKKTESHNKQN